MTVATIIWVGRVKIWSSHFLTNQITGLWRLPKIISYPWQHNLGSHMKNFIILTNHLINWTKLVLGTATMSHDCSYNHFSHQSKRSICLTLSQGRDLIGSHWFFKIKNFRRWTFWRTTGSWPVLCVCGVCLFVRVWGRVSYLFLSHFLRLCTPLMFRVVPVLFFSL